MDKVTKVTKSFRVKKDNVDKVKKLAKENNRTIGGQLDVIIESYNKNS